MLCPVCENPLVVVERDNVELDWCPVCNGFWFDADEWKLIGVEDEKYNPFTYEAVKVNEKGRQCPICDKMMDKIKIGETILDRCPNFHGLWFDKNELSRFVNDANSNEINTKTVNFLGEVFSIKK
ncbi:MAG: zf-TFIIB domain-containing protein [Candidatus Gastranaerophilales bacterium]|nr:zf-TFIIB domain-containing protein [Candidatus Gastranaerophilales bacterium]